MLRLGLAVARSQHSRAARPGFSPCPLPTGWRREEITGALFLLPETGQELTPRLVRAAKIRRRH